MKTLVISSVQSSLPESSEDEEATCLLNKIKKLIMTTKILKIIIRVSECQLKEHHVDICCDVT
jgi:hypothetical protein